MNSDFLKIWMSDFLGFGYFSSSRILNIGLSQFLDFWFVGFMNSCISPKPILFFDTLDSWRYGFVIFQMSRFRDFSKLYFSTNVFMKLWNSGSCNLIRFGFSKYGFLRTCIYEILDIRESAFQDLWISCFWEFSKYGFLKMWICKNLDFWNYGFTIFSSKYRFMLWGYFCFLEFWKSGIVKIRFGSEFPDFWKIGFMNFWISWCWVFLKYGFLNLWIIWTAWFHNFWISGFLVNIWT